VETVYSCVLLNCCNFTSIQYNSVTLTGGSPALSVNNRPWLR